jgi:hypothetical protein
MLNVLTKQETILLIAELEDILLASIAKCNIKCLELLLADAIIFFDEFSHVLDKEVIIDTYRSKLISIYEIILYKRDIHVFDSAVVVSTKLKIKGIYAKIMLNGTYQYVRTWTKVNGEWKVISSSCSTSDG